MWDIFIDDGTSGDVSRRVGYLSRRDIHHTYDSQHRSPTSNPNLFTLGVQHLTTSLTHRYWPPTLPRDDNREVIWLTIGKKTWRIQMTPRIPLLDSFLQHFMPNNNTHPRATFINTVLQCIGLWAQGAKCVDVDRKKSSRILPSFVFKAFFMVREAYTW